MTKKIIYVVALMVALLSTSCATLFTGTSDMIHFSSNPQGAKVYLDGIELCTTPCDIPMQRSMSQRLVEFKLDGYSTRVVPLDKEINPVTLVNIISVPVVGFVVDLISGSFFRYSRKHYEIDLSAKQALQSGSVKRIEIDSVRKIVDLYVASSEQ